MSKLKEDSGAFIYVRNDYTTDYINELNVHPPYLEKTGSVIYDFAINVEKVDLKYRTEKDTEIELVVKEVDLNGKNIMVTVGTIGEKNARCQYRIQ